MDINKIVVDSEESDGADPKTPRKAETLAERAAKHGVLSHLQTPSFVDRMSDQASLTHRLFDATGCATRLREQIEAATSASSQLRAAAAAQGLLDSFSPIRSFLDDADRMRRAMDPFAGYGELIRAQLKPLDTARSLAAGYFDDGAIAQMRKDAEALAGRFTMPELSGLSLLASRVELNLGDAYGLKAETLKNAFAGLQSPWLDKINVLGSAGALARVQGLGHLLDIRPAFDIDFTSLVRTNFGDWRERITLPADIIEYPVRTSFYDERGFDRALVDVPDSAFDENLELAGLAFADEDNDVEGGEDDAALARTNQLHAALQKFEILLRQFIDQVMTDAFGPDWARHRLPNNMLDGWVYKREQDARGDTWRPIDYADFTDYERIITRADNFREAFGTFFERSELLRESMQRLAPSRIAAMHARPLGRDDVLLAVFEIRRLMLIIRKHVRN